MKDSRDKKLVLKDKDGLEVNRNEGFGFVGGATISSEEGYLTAKFLPGAGAASTWNNRPAFDTAPRWPVWPPPSAGAP